MGGGSRLNCDLDRRARDYPDEKNRRAAMPKNKGKNGKGPHPCSLKPSERERLQVMSMIANGATIEFTAQSFRETGISVNTLKKHFAEEIAQGKEHHKMSLLNRMEKLSQQSVSPTTAFRATAWMLSTRHGMNEENPTGMPLERQNDENEIEDANRRLEERLLRFLPPGLLDNGPEPEGDTIEHVRLPPKRMDK
jgi:hypothetical protein